MSLLPKLHTLVIIVLYLLVQTITVSKAQTPTRIPTAIPSTRTPTAPTASPSFTITTCPDGYSQSGSGNLGNGLSCTKCSANYYSAAGASSCTACPSNSYSVVGSGTCVCNDGYSTSGSGSTSTCTICAANYHSVATTCPTGYTYSSTTGSCYKMVVTAQNYFTSLAGCNSASNGYLVNIGSATENSYVLSTVIGTSTSLSSWIGANDVMTELTYDQLHGTLAYTNWNTGEPNDYGASEDCGEIAPSGATAGLWNDNQCKNNVYSICEADVLKSCTACATGKISPAGSTSSAACLTRPTGQPTGFVSLTIFTFVLYLQP